MITMPSFVYGDKTYKYSVQFLSSRKKAISIHVLPNATVEVKAPSHTDKQKIAETMKKRARWIVKHVEQIQSNNAQILPREYLSGETHFYLGRRHMLKVARSDVEQVKLIRGSLVVQCREINRGTIKGLLEEWYKYQADQVFKRRLAAVSENIEWLNEAPSLTVRHMKKQWGSCSPKGRVSLNWNLVKAPLECIDYVIAHELCHLKEHNHSKQFYALMDKYFPDWKSIKSKLDYMADLLIPEE